eukprot:TRINITY_DN7815_c0_g3_i2.p1 TRINITY_DN7815_c0_g3~~TRINITY_DN7815_c0_g3_i2.p1  ORF type:complete len:220 (-),score=67.56 TRINITY_DN7815_c0_g3_i2:161-820(-)
MQYAYIFGVLSYQVANSHTGGKRLTIEAMQKTALIMLAYSLSKHFFMYPFSRFQTNGSRSIALYIIGGISLLNLIGQFLITFLSLNKYNAGWFVAAFAFGLSDALLAGKQETDVINNTTEIEEENLDACVLGKFVGALLIFLLGGVLKTNSPQILLAILTLALVLACGVSFLRIKKEKDPEKPVAPLKEELVEEQKEGDKVDMLPNDSENDTGKACSEL